jgi:DNA-binding response OmpR family regulator
MMKHRILVVDDEPFNFELIKPVLEEDYDLDYAEAGDVCLKRVDQQTPDIILLDIDMPGMNGYETCEKLKSQSATQNVPVTFLSGLDSVEERLKGYEVGGDDYVTKPFSAKELRRKIEVALKNKQEKEQLKQSASEAMGTAMTAMTSAGELGVVLQFFENSFHSKTKQELAELILGATDNYGLNCTVQIETVTGGDPIVANSSGNTNPLEKELLQVLKTKGRLFDFGCRTVINFAPISLLIKNMPLDDNDKYGRIKDNVAILIEGAASRANALTAEEKLKCQNVALEKIVAGAQSSLNTISDQQQQYKKASVEIMDELMQQIENSFMYLGLSEEQENTLLKATQTALDKALNLYDQNYEVDQQLRSIVEQLEKVLRFI